MTSTPAKAVVRHGDESRAISRTIPPANVLSLPVASRVIPPDWIIYRHYHIAEHGNRGAYARTARAFGVSDEHVRNVVRRHVWRLPDPPKLCRVDLPLATVPVRGALDNPLPIILAHNAIALRATRWIPIIALAYLVPIGVLLPAPWQLVLLVPIVGAAWVAG